MKIIGTADYNGMARRAANLIKAQVLLKPGSVLGLATGSTPIGLYKELIAAYENRDLDFAQVCSVNLDEYCGLPARHDQSYRYYMNDNLFSHVNIKPENTNLPDGCADDMDAECARYDKVINDLGGADIQLLGIGHTGHIGFNEPAADFPKGTHVVTLNDKTIEANARFFKSAGEVPKQAVTMGVQAIMQAKRVLLVANGEGKAEILYRALFGPVTPEVPASILQFHSNLVVVADEPALALIRANCPCAIG